MLLIVAIKDQRWPSEGSLCSLEWGKKGKKATTTFSFIISNTMTKSRRGNPLHQWHQTKTRKGLSDPNWPSCPLTKKNKQNCKSTHSMTDVYMFG
jgi:hypothetical protein